MRTAREMYPDLGDGDRFYGCGDYTPIIESLGSIEVRHDDDDYQGDTFALVKDSERYGYVEIGWGSCSGCDALQGAESYDDVDKLAASIANGVRWFDNAAAALEWFRTTDWDGMWSHSSVAHHHFVATAIGLLESRCK